MLLRQDPDVWRSASHRLMATHLTAPFSEGAADRAIAIDSSGRVSVPGSREPLLLAAPAVALDNVTWRLQTLLDPDGTASPLPSLQFDPYSEAGAFLPLHCPDTDSETGFASPSSIQLTLTEIADDGSESVVPAAELTGKLEVRLVEGVLGRVIYVLGAEKARLRRQAREICAMRRLPRARDNALDRMGAEVGVPRFEDHIVFKNNEISTEMRTESDADYRRRLNVYRPFVIPNRNSALQLLNGPGAEGTPNQGALGELGLQQRVRLLEQDNEFAFSLHLIESGASQALAAFLNYIRQTYLVLPEDSAGNNDIHQSRHLPSTTRQRTDQLRARLRDQFAFSTQAAIAPMLAAALDRVGRCRAALGDTQPWKIIRAQDATAGSRYELGLGVDVAPPPVASLDAMRARLLDPTTPPAADPEVEGILSSMAPLTAAEDPEGGWLLRSCGLRTVHRIDTGSIYLSHLPTFGLKINDVSAAPTNSERALEARFHAPGDPGKNVVLVSGLDTALTQWQAQGGAAWTSLSDAQAHNRWDNAAALAPGTPGLGIFRASGLPAVEDPTDVVARLKRLPEELLETVRLAAPQAGRILAGDVAAADELRRLLDVLREQGLSSVLPLITGPNEVLLVVSVIGLPAAGINLSDRRATGFRWYVVPIDGAGGQIKSMGSRTTFVPDGSGLSAVVVVGYARRGATDPYEFRVELPDDARLNIQQYEFLMNVLGHVHPLGVEVNTFSIRQRHVDLDGDGNAEPLLPSVFRTFRQFRRTRHRGTAGVGIEQS